jgi:branched-chain amino acid transport system substrate-binding protein
VSTNTRNARQREFIKQYTDAYGSAPDLLASQSFEAMEMVAYAIRRSSSGDRNELVNQIATLKDFESPLGNLTFDGTRIAQRRIPILRVETGGNIVEE